MTKMSFVLELQGVVLILGTALMVWSYVFTSFGLPLADDVLNSMDEAMGFDWLSFVRAVDANAFLAHALFLAYVSFGYQLMLLPLLLVSLNALTRAYVMMLSFAFICFSAGIISIWFPALSAYSAYVGDLPNLRNVNPHFGYAFINQFNAVRSGQPFVISAGQMEGILTFPSCHAAVGFLCAWAAWSSRSLRYPFLLLNIAMCVSAITHGSHYLVDVIVGIAVAMISIAAANLFIFGRSPKVSALAAASQG